MRLLGRIPSSLLGHHDDGMWLIPHALCALDHMIVQAIPCLGERYCSLADSLASLATFPYDVLPPSVPILLSPSGCSGRSGAQVDNGDHCHNGPWGLGLLCTT